MKKARRLFWIVAVFAVCALALTACGGDAVEEGVVVNDEGQIICPLDGQVLDSAEDHGDYLFIVSIDNGAGSEPQSGIGDADLLMEIPVEGGITRFMAFFYHSTPDTIGPVRSSRHYLYDFVNGYDAVFAHCGGSPQAYEVIDSGTVKDIDELKGVDAFWRSSERRAPHNLYTSYENLAGVAADREYATVALADCPSFAFMGSDELDDLTFGGVTDFVIPYRFKEVLFQWDETEKRYQRYSASDLTIDAANGEPVLSDNIVVLYAENHLIAGDDSGRLDMEIKEGEGLLLQYGNVIEITWTCNEGEGFVFLDAATGEEVKLIPGKTIINIADPTSEPAEYEKGAE